MFLNQLQFGQIIAKGQKQGEARNTATNLATRSGQQTVALIVRNVARAENEHLDDNTRVFVFAEPKWETGPNNDIGRLNKALTANEQTVAHREKPMEDPSASSSYGSYGFSHGPNP